MSQKSTSIFDSFSDEFQRGSSCSTAQDRSHANMEYFAVFVSSSNAAFHDGNDGMFWVLIAANSKVRHCEVWGKTPCLPSTNPSGVMTDMKMMVLDISGTGERLLIFDHSAVTQL
jgi:hypothetical protein